MRFCCLHWLVFSIVHFSLSGTLETVHICIWMHGRTNRNTLSWMRGLNGHRTTISNVISSRKVSVVLMLLLYELKAGWNSFKSSVSPRRELCLSTLTLWKNFTTSFLWHYRMVLVDVKSWVWWLHNWHVLHVGHQLLIVESLLVLRSIHSWSIFICIIPFGWRSKHFYLVEFRVLKLEDMGFFEIQNLHFVFAELNVGLTTIIMACLTFINDRLGACWSILDIWGFVLTLRTGVIGYLTLLCSTWFNPFACYLRWMFLLWHSALIKNDSSIFVRLHNLSRRE